MGIFEDMIAEIEAYPANHVVIEVFDVSLDGDVLNVGETGFFKVRVTNNGPLDLTNVKLKVDGRNGVNVRAGLGLPFESQFISVELPQIDAHGGVQVLQLPAFEAPDQPQDEKTLLNVTLSAWNTNFNHPVIDHSDPVDVPKGIFASAVAAE